MNLSSVPVGRVMPHHVELLDSNNPGVVEVLREMKQD